MKQDTLPSETFMTTNEFSYDSKEWNGLATKILVKIEQKQGLYENIDAKARGKSQAKAKRMAKRVIPTRDSSLPVSLLLPTISNSEFATELFHDLGLLKK
jgi:hypothetical protein